MFGLMEQKRGKFLAFHLGAAGLKKKKKNGKTITITGILGTSGKRGAQQSRQPAK